MRGRERVLLVVWLFGWCGVCVAQTYRSYNGANNNLNNPSWGSAGTPHIQPSTLSYPDGNSLPVGRSARDVSNGVFSAIPQHPYNPRFVSDLYTYWGQFVEHDITLTPAGNEREDISVPSCDAIFDPYCTGNVTMPFYRSAPYSGQGTMSTPRVQYNLVSSFIDASHIYGCEEERAVDLRESVGGRLRLNPTTHYLPFNTHGLANQNPTRQPPSSLFVAGDIRVNENPGLTSLHTIFAREHNRIANQLSAKNPTWTDEKIYQEARKWVGALIASITYNEYLPIALGSPLSTYTAYKPTVNPSVTSLFTAMAFRYGQSEVNTWIPRLGADGKPIEKGGILFRDSYFRPSTWAPDGLEPLIRGAASQVQQNVDLYYVDDIRNFLFGLPNSGGVDLAAYSIQRGRDHGLPTYNDVRAMYELDPAWDFNEISSSADIAARLQSLYGDVDRVDGFVGGLAEDKRPNANLGSLFSAIVREQFTSLRDGDRYFYKNTAVSGFTVADVQQIDGTRLSHVILRNTNISQIQCDAFYTLTSKMCFLKPDGTIGIVTPSPPPSLAPTPPPTLSSTPTTAPASVHWEGTNVTLVDGRVVLNYVIPTEQTSSFVTFRLAVKNYGVGWIGLGFPKTPNVMVPANAVIAIPPTALSRDLSLSPSLSLEDVRRKAGGSVNTYVLNDYQECTGNAGVCPSNTFSISDSAVALFDEWTVVTFTYEVADVTSIPIIYAYGTSNVIAYHGPNYGSAIVTPTDPCGTQQVIGINYSLVSAHGIMMGIAFLFLFPLGAFISAFGRKLGNLWFTLHVTLQISGLFFMAIGFMIILVFSTQFGKGHFRNGHGVFGLIVILLAIISMSLGATAANMYDPDRSATPIFPDGIHRYIGLLTLFFALINLIVGSAASANVTGEAHSFIYWAVLIVYELVIVCLYIGLTVIKRYRPSPPQQQDEDFPK